jgi:hypothetical protein
MHKTIECIVIRCDVNFSECLGEVFYTSLYEKMSQDFPVSVFNGHEMYYACWKCAAKQLKKFIIKRGKK